jgi:hypothetical protein
MSELQPFDGHELEALHDAITLTLKACMPDVLHIEAFPDLENNFKVPALFFGLTEFRPGVDTGTGKTAIRGKFQAVILVDSVLKHAPLHGMWLATRLASVLRGQYWGLDFTEESDNVHAEPDGSNPELAAFVVWTVQWTQTFHIGDVTEWPFPWPDNEPPPIEAEPGIGVAEVIVEVDRP